MQKITFFILSTSGSPVKQITFSKIFLYFIFFLMISGIGLAGYGIHNYYKVKTVLSDTEELENKITYQADEIIIQKKQIQKFADDINSLKTKLTALNGFEKQIRIIAGLENSSNEQNNIFGIGGSMPEDLNPKALLTEKHNEIIREMHNQLEQIDIASSGQKKGFESLMKRLDEQRNILSSTPAICPAKGLITSKFGHRKSPFTAADEFHEGLDISNAKGTNVYAAADGVISFAGEEGAYGNMVIINHGHGLVTRYGHLDEFLKKAGANVKRGEVIGLMGNTGRTTGFHVHYEVYLNGVPINPEKYILD